MIDRADSPAAWVIAVRMGYGHQRTAYPLRGLAPGGDVLLADGYPGMPDSDRRVWERMRRFYEFISKAHDLRAIGPLLFKAFDRVQSILSYYPRRDLSRADLNVRFLYSFFERGWGRDLIGRLKADGRDLPIVTSFYAPAFMAEFFDYPGDIYCVLCDTDIARAWASLRPASSRIQYFAPTRRVAQRLREYGVAAGRVHLTGYPLPEENVGTDLAVLKDDLAQRIVNLDPERRYIQRYGSLVAEKVGPLPDGPTRPLTILFSIGGAGAQAEIARELLLSLKPRILNRDVRLVISAGIKPWVREYVEQSIAETGLVELTRVIEAGKAPPGEEDAGVHLLVGTQVTEYFASFDRALRAADILWTKPSELSFYCALGLPIVMAPPIGAQEKANEEWLLRLGAATLQGDPGDTHEWLFDLLDSGWFAEAAMEGFVEGEQQATPQIGAIVQRRAPLGTA